MGLLLWAVNVLAITSLPAPLVRVELMGFTTDGGWAALETHTDGHGQLRLHRTDGTSAVWAAGPEAELLAKAARSGWTRTAPRQPGQRLPDGLVVEVRPAGGLGRPARTTVEVMRDGDRVLLAELPSEGAIEAGELWLAPDQRSAILELRYDGRPNLLALDLNVAKAKLLVIGALRLARDGAIEEAAARLELAVEAAPGLGEPYYDLACLHALLGDLDRAAAELRLALAIDAGRFGRLAKKDPDLDGLRAEPELWASLLLGD
ncbi:MAG: hypothetical protein IPG45_38975 [Deltaproteobacteria bacterium]|jgi:hypothetical protein|nr:hypothetical protein [Deltaproteobacteria bacterium]